jgi:DNA-damage-inducible protein D
MENELVIFEKKNIRRVELDGVMYFSIVDIIEILTESTAPSKYWDAVKRREPQLSTICRKLKLLSLDGRKRPSDCADTEGVLRIVMAVPSPKAEPLKLWLAQMGKQAIEEAENPELLTERQAELYRAKGYSDEWIKRRIQTIETRKELTDEWKARV